MQSSSFSDFRVTVWSPLTGIGRITRLSFAIGIFSMAADSVLASDWRTMPAPASAAPQGLILGDPEAPTELAVNAEAIDLTASEKLVAPEIELTALVDDAATQAEDQRAKERRDRDAKEKEAKDKEAKNACGDQATGCREALKALRNDGIETIALDIRVGGRPGSDYPCECRLEGETFKPRRFTTTMMTWKAAGNCHKPLYFEDWNLERYGHSHGPLDPIFSAAHFFVTLPILPYKMGVELPWECIYPLGYYRPGNCAPWTVPAPPISCRGFAMEAATVTGLVFLLP